uniref:FBA_2 domain-containing protein n=2 Tax=Caenorhabditis tropicalis TaxID=1561998 RepID=A0A1I7UU18_9PELO
MPLCLSKILRSIYSSLCSTSDSYSPSQTPLPSRHFDAFPLLQLPLVAMEHVLCMMNPFELIDVSLASSRAKTAVKNFSKTQKKFSVLFSVGGPSISLTREQMKWLYRLSSSEEEAGFLAYIYPYHNILNRENLVINVSKEPLKDIMKWFDYVKEVLNCQIDNVSFKLLPSSLENRRTTDWIAAQNSMVNEMEISNNVENLNDDVKYIMERIHVTGSLNLSIWKYKEDFRMEIPGKPYHLHINNSKFIDYDQLLRLKSPVIILRQSILTSQEINRFLKSWMSCETHLELEALKISISGPDAMNEIMDLPHEKTNDPELVEAFKSSPHHIQVKTEMFTIKRCDGKKRATVVQDRSTLYLLVH